MDHLREGLKVMQSEDAPAPEPEPAVPSPLPPAQATEKRPMATVPLPGATRAVDACIMGFRTHFMQGDRLWTIIAVMVLATAISALARLIIRT